MEKLNFLFSTSKLCDGQAGFGLSTDYRSLITDYQPPTQHIFSHLQRLFP